MHILIVEDDYVNRRYIRTILVNEGHSTVEAVDAMQALDSLENETFDVVLWDIRLPGISGLEAARRIRTAGQEYSDVPMVAVTAYAMKSDCPGIIEAGLDGCVTKPFTPEELISALYGLDRDLSDDLSVASSA